MRPHPKLLHAGFSNCGYCYCSHCPADLVFSSFDSTYTSICGDAHPWTLDAATLRGLADRFVACPCGGRFSFENRLRCPGCGAPLRPGMIDTIECVVLGELLDGSDVNVWAPSVA